MWYSALEDLEAFFHQTRSSNGRRYTYQEVRWHRVGERRKNPSFYASLRWYWLLVHPGEPRFHGWGIEDHARSQDLSLRSVATKAVSRQKTKVYKTIINLPP